MFTRAKYELSDLLDPMDGFVSGYSSHHSLRSVPDCGDPDCIGLCDHDREYEAYGLRMVVAERRCKVQQAKLHVLDHESTNCGCQLCLMEMSNQNEEE